MQVDRHRPKKSLPVYVPDDTGRGLQVDKHRPKRSLPAYVPNPNPPTPKSECRLIYPPAILPLIGSWQKPIGMGLKKKTSRKAKKGDGLLTGLLGLPQSQTWNNIPLLGQII